MKQPAHAVDQVVQEVGLGICVYDILKASDGLISAGDGAANVNVEFRLVVFRPFKGEILLGRIGAAGPWGMKSTVPSTSICGLELTTSVQLDFFDEIIVSPDMLFEGSVLYECIAGDQRYLLTCFGSDHHEQHWIWYNDGNKFEFEKYLWVRVRVEDEIWHDTSPTAPHNSQEATASERKSPYRIVASMQQAGLGVVSWWRMDEG